MDVPVTGYPEGGSEERGDGGGRTDLTAAIVEEHSQATKSVAVSSSDNMPMPFPFPKPSNDSIVGELGGLSLDSLHIEDIENPQIHHAPYKNQIFRSPNNSMSSLAGELGKHLTSSFNSDVSSSAGAPKVGVVNRPRQGNRLGGFAKWAEAKRAKVYPDIPEDFVEVQNNSRDLKPPAEGDREDSLFGEELDVDDELPEPHRYQVNYNTRRSLSSLLNLTT